jgi:signal transduction histidine kinase
MLLSQRSRGVSMCLALICMVLSSCRSGQTAPSVEFTHVPRASPGGRDTPLQDIDGRVTGARGGQQIVLFARSGPWWVQPFTDHPFTAIQADSRWKNQTHLGTEYAALLVEPGYRPPPMTDVLPAEGAGVVAVAVVEGTPVFWRTRSFQVATAVVCVIGVLALHRLRLRQLTRQLNVRFEERLAERTRIAQELHDTLLQGVISASMQLHVAVEHVPPDAPSRSRLNGVLDLMERVVEEGRDAVKGLRSSDRGSDDLVHAFTRIRDDLAIVTPINFRAIVNGTQRPLHPFIRDEVYRVGREALVNAFRHSSAKSIEVEIEYAPNQLRMLVRDDGGGMDPGVVRSGREGHWGLSGMQERAEQIGGRLKLRSRKGAGTEVELSVPGHIAFQAQPSNRSHGWFARLYRGRTPMRSADTRSGERP